MTKARFLKTWSVAAGAMDFLTGLLLVVAPGFVLGLLRIEQPSADALVFLSWIGVFVAAVGLSYGLALGKSNERGETVWMITATVRIMVAGFLIFRIMDGSLSVPWTLVAVSDAGVAAVQFAILRLGWWREEAG